MPSATQGSVHARLLEPGSGPGYAVAGDPAVLAALVRAELAWVDVLVGAGAAPPSLATSLRSALEEDPPDAVAVATAAGSGGNPVIPLVTDLRSRVGDDGRWVHSGLTSQDVLDTALMLLGRDALDAVSASLTTLGDTLAALSQEHRASVMAGRTLTQHAVPVTFGLRAAQWLLAVSDCLDEVEACRAALPVQCGGAAGTLAALDVVVPGKDPLDLAAAWAEGLGLTWPGAPWHTRRRPLTRLGDVLAAVTAALGHVATDVATLSRPEIAEVSEDGAEGRGGSSTMPHKHNPVQSVLVRSMAIQAGPLAGVLHQCSALAVDERPDGAWHAEWPTLQRLLVLAVTASATTATLVSGLRVDPPAMAARAASAADLLLAERQGLVSRLGAAAPGETDGDTADDQHEDPDDVRSYLGSAVVLTDAAVERWRERPTR